MSSRLTAALILTMGLWGAHAVFAATDSSSGAVAADGAASQAPRFEETTPPRWTPESTVQVQKNPDEDPLMQKIREVNSELDKAGQPSQEPLKLPSRTNDKPIWRYALQSVFVLLLVLAAFFFFSYVIKRFFSKSPIFAGSTLAKVVGRVHLAPRTSLYYVRSGGRILVVGVAPNALSLVAEYDAVAFEEAQEKESAELSPVAVGDNHRPVESAPAAGFLEQLRAGVSRARTAERAAERAAEPSPGDEIDALKEEVERLQRFLSEGTREEKV